MRSRTNKDGWCGCIRLLLLIGRLGYALVTRLLIELVERSSSWYVFVNVCEVQYLASDVREIIFVCHR